jgi:hypothetical protein
MRGNDPTNRSHRFLRADKKVMKAVQPKIIDLIGFYAFLIGPGAQSN